MKAVLFACLVAVAAGCGLEDYAQARVKCGISFNDSLVLWTRGQVSKGPTIAGDCSGDVGCPGCTLLQTRARCMLGEGCWPMLPYIHDDFPQSHGTAGAVVDGRIHCREFANDYNDQEGITCTQQMCDSGVHVTPSVALLITILAVFARLM